MAFFSYFISGIKSIFLYTIKFIKYFLIGLFNIVIFIPKYFIIGISFIFSKKKRATIKNSENKKLSWAIIGTSLSVYLICVFLFSRWYVQGLKIKYLSEQIINSTEIIEKETKKEEQTQPTEPETPNTEETNNNNANVYYPNDYWDYMNVPFMNVDFNELLKKNPDTVGWIKVEGTKVNYPVVQSTDNDYYLSHAFNKTANQGGWIFADYRVNFKDFGKNTIIYGHNRQNNSMFGTLSNVFKEEWLSNKENHYINFSTLNNNMVWEVFSTYTIEKEEYYIQSNFSSDEEYISFLNTIKNRSTYKYDVNISKEDKILTLSTCTNVGKGRTVLHAKLIYRK